MEDFEILHGDLHDLPDTKNFLSSLSDLAAAKPENDAKYQARELKAAAAFFNWEVGLFYFRLINFDYKIGYEPQQAQALCLCFAFPHT